MQQRQSLNISREDKSTGINTQLDSVIPASKISNLSQGVFVGAVADNFGDNIPQKMFHAQIVVDVEKVKAEEKQYRPIPVLSDFTDENGKDRMAEVIEANYYRIKQEAAQIVEDELRRIADDPKLKHLFKGNETVANQGERRANEGVKSIFLMMAAIHFAEQTVSHNNLKFKLWQKNNNSRPVLRSSPTTIHSTSRVSA